MLELIAMSQQNDYNIQELSDKVSNLSYQLKALGAINLMIFSELTEIEQCFNFYQNQYDDILISVQKLKEAIQRIDNVLKNYLIKLCKELIVI